MGSSVVDVTARQGSAKQTSGGGGLGTSSTPRNFVPLRADPTTPDGDDARRVQWALGLWSGQDDLWRHRNRQIEENIRMLSGQQWSAFNPVTGRWMDVSEWVDKDDFKWKQFPVVNRLLPWFIVTHARLTENPPIITFVPGPDRIDAELAEMKDIVFKTLWREAGMVDVVDRMMAWLIPSGQAHLMTRVDLDGGELQPWVGADTIPVVGPDGQHTGDFAQAEGVPFDREGNPLATMSPDGTLNVTGEPHAERKGRITVDVLSPLQVRRQWGPHAWQDAEWHAVRSYLTPAQIFARFSVDVQADTRSGGGDAGELERVLFGTGFFGAMEGQYGRMNGATNASTTEGYVEVTTIWHGPQPYGGMEETVSSPGGRYTVVTRDKVLYDGVRPVRYPHVSPIRTFEFVRIPGRPAATSPQDAMNPVQRMYNRGVAQIDRHVALMTNPKPVIDDQSGIEGWTNEPGVGFKANLRQGVSPVQFITPPALGPDTYKFQGMLLQELTDLGQLHGTQGETPTPDASGELVKELRFNSDRFLGPTVRRAVEEFARLAEDWMAVIPSIWDEETILSYAGDDNRAVTLTVKPQLFEQGKVNAVPDVESMLPEGRGERQQRIFAMYAQGLFGQPGSPVALKRFFDLARFPHMSRTAKPGGVDRVTADQFNAALLQGADPRTLPVYEWYDSEVHLSVLEEFMKSPEFLKVDENIKAGFVFRRMALQQLQAMQMQRQMAMQMAMNPPPLGGPPKPGAPAPAGAQSARPALPSPPTGGPPGGQMPTSAGVSNG